MPNILYIGGDQLPYSIAEFVHKCEIYIEDEQRKSLPDNGLIALLCDAIRLSREYCSAVVLPHSEIQAAAIEALANEWHSWMETGLRERATLIRKQAKDATVIHRAEEDGNG